MFYIIGIGLKPKQISFEAIETITKCKEIYIDNYTNIFSKGNIKDLEKIINKKIIPLNRKELEQEQKFIKKKNCLLVIGNALSATTHFSIIKDAEKKNIKTKIITGISIFNYRGACGLYEYKFGKTVSIVYPLKNFNPKSFYETILENIKIGAHTLCLLDIKVDENKFMTCKEACEILEQIDEKKILKEKECVAYFSMGSNKEEIIKFKFKEYKEIKTIKKYPQSLIICGNLNEFEKGAINEHRT
ncbi:MAG: diphthine synthase [Candidatus ainarchaeum sp.]|nr:diphthine synthase [Candidatus ainarchaeum sp.]MDD3976235.1 diphthine synthase [Candidatus ainarchaeum sp.]